MSHTNTTATTTVQVQTTHGPVSGLVEDGVSRFLGIPYAAAPVDELRFDRPVPPEPWTHVRECHGFGPTAARPLGGPFDEMVSGKDAAPGDSCLNLNVWTPDASGGTALPVMVWIHGGAFLRGSSAGTLYDGTAFARDGVVCVTLNYRLGVEGFGRIEDAPVPANRGLLDQIRALEWVRDNIARFGGDPGRVTLFGESAGAMSVLSLLSLDLGLFHRAIAQSGSAHVVQQPEDAARVLRLIAERLGVEPTAAGLGGLKPEAIIPAQAAVHREITASPDPEKHGASTVETGGVSLAPVVDGELLTRAPIDALAQGCGADIPLLIGTTVEEQRYFVLPPMLPQGTGTGGGTDEPGEGVWRERFAAYVGAGSDEILDAYAAGAPTGPYAREGVREAFAAAMSDRLFRVPSIRTAEVRADAAVPTYFFEFGWRTPKQYLADRPLGACHVVDIAFVWDTLTVSGADELLQDPPAELAAAMHARWVEFATTGELARWPRYDIATRPVMVFFPDNAATDGVEKVVRDPRGDERALWDGRMEPRP